MIFQNTERNFLSKGLPSILLSLVLSACATVGKDFSFAGPDSIQIGQTSQSQVLKTYGEPFRVGYNAGQSQWSYVFYKYNAFSTTQTKDLVVTFDKHHIVSDYTYGSSMETDKKAMLPVQSIQR